MDAWPVRFYDAARINATVSWTTHLKYLLSVRPGGGRPSATLAVYLLAGLCAVITPAFAETATAAAASTAQSSLTERREAAVQNARRGQIPAARQRLEQLFADHPGDQPLRMDLAVVAAWDGDPARCAGLLDALDAGSLPDYVLDSYAKATRDLQRWDRSIALYQRLRDRQPERIEFVLAQALVMTDANRFEAAEQVLAQVQTPLPARPAERAEVHFTRGYLAQRQEQFTAALTHYSQTLELVPDHAAARRGHLLSAAALGAVYQALARARAEPGLVTQAELIRLQLDAAAMHVRWAALPDAASGRPHASIALAMQDDLLAHPGLRDAQSTPGRALSFDRIAALVADKQMAEAITAFEAAVSSNQQETSPEPAGGGLDAFPAYVLGAAAEAYLYLRQPQRAAELYRAALRQDPERLELQAGLFYALSDQMDHAAAEALAADLLAAQPAWSGTEPGRWQANPQHAAARELVAMELAFRERYGEALGHLDGMLDIAPANTSLRLARAQVNRWRGHGSAAHGDVVRVRVQDPDNFRARALEGELALDAQRYRQAERALTDTVTLAPHARPTLNLAQRWINHNRPLLSISADAGRSDGGAFSSRDWRVDSYYFSRPLAYRYRVFVHDVAVYGRFDEGAGRDHRLGAGLEYRPPDWLVRGAIHQGLQDNDGFGASISAWWQRDDHLTLRARAAANSVNAPLRGTRVDIRGDELEVGGTYRWHEAREASAAAGMLDLDDGNLRQWLQMNLRTRLLNRPAHKILADTRVYSSRNSERDSVYYNPAADRELSVGLTHEWRIFHDYQHALTQRLGVEAGNYWQRGFGSGPVWTWFAEQQWLLGPRSSVTYGLRSGGRIYDGNREHMANLYLSVEWRP